MQISTNIKRSYAGLRARSGIRQADTYTSPMKGEIFLTIREGGVIKKQDMFNVVTADASILIARLMKDPTDPAGGVMYMALGSGSGTWDTGNPPPPTGTETQLVAELSRVPVTASDFIDPNSGLPTGGTPTKIVDFDFSFGPTDAVGPLLELALIGGDATTSPNTGTALTYKTFPIITKTTSMTLDYTYRLTF